MTLYKIRDHYKSEEQSINLFANVLALKRELESTQKELKNAQLYVDAYKLGNNKYK